MKRAKKDSDQVSNDEIIKRCDKFFESVMVKCEEDEKEYDICSSEENLYCEQHWKERNDYLIDKGREAGRKQTANDDTIMRNNRGWHVMFTENQKGRSET